MNIVVDSLPQLSPELAKFTSVFQTNRTTLDDGGEDSSVTYIVALPAKSQF